MRLPTFLQTISYPELGYYSDIVWMRIQGNMHNRLYRSDVWRQIALKVSQTTCYVFEDIKTN